MRYTVPVWLIEATFKGQKVFVDTDATGEPSFVADPCFVSCHIFNSQFADQEHRHLTQNCTTATGFKVVKATLTLETEE